MEQLVAQLVAVIGADGAGVTGEELRWVDASDVGDSTGNDGYALAETPGAAAASVTIRFGFGTTTVAADGLCVIDSR